MEFNILSTLNFLKSETQQIVAEQIRKYISDFLPFECDGCGKTFCLQHRSRDEHMCTVEIQHVSSTPHSSEKYSCSVPNCEKQEFAQMVCHHCGLNVCLSHRLQEDHNCVKLPPKRPSVSKTSEHVQQLLAGKEIKPRAKPTNPKAIQMAAKVALMKLKGRAVGDQGIPQDERVYFNVVLPLESKKSSMALFFSKVWTVGKVVDVIAERASLPNYNNTGVAQKLRLFHGNLGTKLPTDKQLSELMAAESHYLISGVTLVLESVSDDVDVLENLQAYSV